MNIIGINYLSESSVCLIKNGKLISAISEERINRIKNWFGIPYKTIKLILDKNNLKYSDINFFVTTGTSVKEKSIPQSDIYLKKKKKIENSNLSKKNKNIQLNFLKKRIKHEDHVINIRTKNILKKLEKKFKNLLIYDHHFSHAASACFASGIKDCYCLTIDGWGDDSSSKIYKFKNGNLNQFASTPTIDSLGYFYGSITKLLGFKPHQHEGKILGLAAYGRNTSVIKEIENMISYDNKTKQFVGNYEKGLYQAKFDNPNLNYLKKKYSREQIAYSTQKALEKTVIKCVKSLSKKKINLVLAGGVFANVKLNQKLYELKNIKKLYVFPNMGDGGLSVGAAQFAYFEKTNKIPKKVDTMYLGNEFSEKFIINELKKYNLYFTKPKNIEKEIAIHLAKKKVVAHFSKRMEFGPRALGNRSILCSADDASINQSLNKKLKRTEFMPFAPILRKKDAKKYFIISKKVDYKFMTFTLNCKNSMIKEAPAAVHIDKTARPQIISKLDNKRLYKILEEYNKITGTPILINTSFNMHEEPIVHSPNDAIRAFLLGNLDYLVLDKFLISKK
jgi:carbamoyltransferase